MRVVVDLGCANRDKANSLVALARKYRPDHLYGFDPSPALDVSKTKVWGVPTTLERKAAWLYDGTVSFHENGSGSRVGHGGHEVKCFDFVPWLYRLEQVADEIIVKMDIEGAEVRLVQRMLEDEADDLIDELLVEWHGHGEELEDRLSCDVRRWWL